MESIQLFDQSISFAVQGIRNPVLDFLMPLFSLLGNMGAIWLATGIALCIPRKYRKYGVMLLLAAALSFLLAEIIVKPIVARPRPCQLFPEVPLLIDRPDDFSFPSGHTIVSFAAATVLWMANWRFGLPATLLALVIGFSRIYLFAHFFTDTLAGLVLGVACAFAAMLLVNLALWVWRRFTGGKGRHYDLS